MTNTQQVLCPRGRSCASFYVDQSIMNRAGHITHWGEQQQHNIMVGCLHSLLQELRTPDCTVWIPDCDCHGPVNHPELVFSVLTPVLSVSWAWAIYYNIGPLMLTRAILAPGAGIPSIQNQIKLDPSVSQRLSLAGGQISWLLIGAFRAYLD